MKKIALLILFSFISLNQNLYSFEPEETIQFIKELDKEVRSFVKEHSTSIKLAKSTANKFFFIRRCNSLLKKYSVKSQKVCINNLITNYKDISYHLKTASYSKDKFDNFVSYLQNNFSIYKNTPLSIIKLLGSSFYNESFGLILNLLDTAITSFINDTNDILSPKAQAKICIQLLGAMSSDIFFLKSIDNFHAKLLSTFLIENKELIKIIIEKYQKEKNAKNKKTLLKALEGLLTYHYQELRLNLDVIKNVKEHTGLLKIAGEKLAINTVIDLIASNILK